MHSEVARTILTELCDSDTTEAVSMPNAPTAPTLHHIGFRNFIRTMLSDSLIEVPPKLQYGPTRFVSYQHCR